MLGQVTVLWFTFKYFFFALFRFRYICTSVCMYVCVIEEEEQRASDTIGGVCRVFCELFVVGSFYTFFFIILSQILTNTHEVLCSVLRYEYVRLSGCS